MCLGRGRPWVLSSVPPQEENLSRDCEITSDCTEEPETAQERDLGLFELRNADSVLEMEPGACLVPALNTPDQV